MYKKNVTVNKTYTLQNEMALVPMKPIFLKKLVPTNLKSYMGIKGPFSLAGTVCHCVLL